MLQVRPIRRYDVAYPSIRISRGDHMQGFRGDIQNEATRIWPVLWIDLDDLATNDSAHGFGACDPAFQEALERVLVPLNPAFRGGRMEDIGVELLSRSPTPSGSPR